MLRKKVSEDGIGVKYINSACVITSTPDITILHDPWFTDGIYDGSWFSFPQVTDPIETIGDTDCIFISHIHPDHYDINFLRDYFKRFGSKEVLIAEHTPNHLGKKMLADGIEPTIVRGLINFGNTEVQIVPHVTESITDIDSAIIIKYKSENKIHCVINTNDIQSDLQFSRKLKNLAINVDILLCGYSGASSYPQTYFDLSDPTLIIEAENKKKFHLNKYLNHVNEINAKVNIPFAGKYVLGGKLCDLNALRGIPDAVEVLELDPKAIVLSDCGGEINTLDLKASKIRLAPYEKDAVHRRLEEIRNATMSYERLFAIGEVTQLPIKQLLISATINAKKNSEIHEDHYFCFNLNEREWALINANKESSTSISFVSSRLELPVPRSEIDIDSRYLFGLLTKIYHWNNAEIGSQFNTRTFPDKNNRVEKKFLYYLTV